MNARQKLHQAHLAEWAARISDQKASGLSVRQWCSQHDFSIHKYNYWKHQLKEEAVDQMLPDIVPLSLSSLPVQTEPAIPTNSADPNTAFRANRAIRANYTSPNIRICIDGVALELEPSVSEDFLRTLIRAVHYA